MKIVFVIDIDKQSQVQDDEKIGYELSQFLMNEGTILYQDRATGRDIEFKVTGVHELELEMVEKHFDLEKEQ